VTGQWFSSGTLDSSTNKTDHHDITEILVKGITGKHHNPTPVHFAMDVYQTNISGNAIDYCLLS